MSWAFMTSDPDAIGEMARSTVAEMFEAYWPGRRTDSIAEGARFDRVYFGQEFCERLCPTPDEVLAAVDAAREIGLALTLVTGTAPGESLDAWRRAVAAFGNAGDEVGVGHGGAAAVPVVRDACDAAQVGHAGDIPVLGEAGDVAVGLHDVEGLSVEPLLRFEALAETLAARDLDGGQDFLELQE